MCQTSGENWEGNDFLYVKNTFFRLYFFLKNFQQNCLKIAKIVILTTFNKIFLNENEYIIKKIPTSQFSPDTAHIWII